jgi:hypothetical protein
MTGVEELARRQLEAYNRRDIDAFAACYADDVEVRDLATGEVKMSGIAALRERYGAMFAATPDLRAAVDRRIVCGEFAFDHETGQKGGVPFEVLAIYHAKAGKIAKVWFAR